MNVNENRQYGFIRYDTKFKIFTVSWSTRFLFHFVLFWLFLPSSTSLWCHWLLSIHWPRSPSWLYNTLVETKYYWNFDKITINKKPCRYINPEMPIFTYCLFVVPPASVTSPLIHNMLFQTIQAIYFLWGYAPGNMSVSSSPDTHTFNLSFA